MSNLTLLVPPNQIKRLLSFLKSRGYSVSLSDLPRSAVFVAKSDSMTLTLYKSGKLLVQGKSIDKIEQLLYSNGFTLPEKKQTDTIDLPLNAKEWIGVDEVGKGDYFGPLVIAGAVVDKKQLDKLIKLGVRDSKTMADSTALSLSEKIKTLLPCTLVAIDPPAYNRLYKSMRNLNRLLAWGHARVIENLLEKQPALKLAISDQFANASYLEKALLKKGKQIKLIQRTKGEANIAVAAASILARAQFLKSLQRLSRAWKIELRKGAGQPTQRSIAEFVKKHGREKLNEVAKTHFKFKNRT